LFIVKDGLGRLASVSSSDNKSEVLAVLARPKKFLRFKGSNLKKCENEKMKMIFVNS